MMRAGVVRKAPGAQNIFYNTRYMHSRVLDSTQSVSMSSFLVLVGRAFASAAAAPRRRFHDDVG